MKPTVIVVAVVAVVAAAALVLDGVVTSMAEDRAAERVSDELDAPTEVTLHGWPVALRMLVGTVERAEVTATDVPLDEGGALDRLDVTLHDIDLGIGDLQNPPDGLPPARDGDFEASISGDITWALTSVPSMLASLEITGEVVQLQTPVAALSADLVVHRNRLLFEPNVPLGVVFRGDVELDISDQPGSPVLEEAAINDGTLRLRGRFEDLDD